jgi:DNA-binding CsgD family transcriptional regulator
MPLSGLGRQAPALENRASGTLSPFADRRIFRVYMRLGRADLEATLAFLGGLSDAVTSEPDEPDDSVTSTTAERLPPFRIRVLAGLQVLVPSVAVLYQDVDVAHRQFDATAWVGPDDDNDDELYWSSGQCPISEYRARTGDIASVRMSDVITARRYRATALYRDYFLPARMAHLLDVGLEAGADRQRSLVLFREAGARDFSERDRAVLDVVQPHLLRYEADVQLRRRLARALRDAASATASPAQEMGLGLTAREHEIVILVGQGLTNAQIAAQLWIAPSTVKKHLENIYLKVGVGRRAAAVQRISAAN